MYIPKHFEITDRQEICRFIESNAFGQLISTSGAQPFATHMPFLLSHDKNKMIGHIAKQNPQHLDLEGQHVMIILQGPHAYISPSWYTSPGVPTWNYQAVHIYGRCAVFTEHKQLKTIVDSLTAKYEAAFETPWQSSYKAAMLGAIVGVEITIDEIQCKYKLSQNRPIQDREQIAGQLEKQGSAICHAMRGED